MIVNTPNNPTGVVYSEETIKKLAAIMEQKQEEYGTEIYLISDEPYRELVYDGAEVPYLTKYYANTIVGYSYSKSLSLPGERIGYLVIPDEVKDSGDLLTAANVATRILGFVNAPTLQQKVVAKCIHEKTDISYYDRNRETLYNGLKECGFTCIKPEGAFYLCRPRWRMRRNSAPRRRSTTSCWYREVPLHVPAMCALPTAYPMRPS